MFRSGAACQEVGPKGLLLRGVRRILRSSGKWLVRVADSVPSPALSRSFPGFQVVQKNQLLRNKHKGRRCFVIGTGPSVGTQDLSPLADEITVTMGAFWKHPVVEQWQPTYYCVADPLFFDRSEVMKDFFRSLTSRVSASDFIVPLSAAGVIREQGLLPLEQTYYVAFRDALSDRRARDIDFSQFVPSVQSVSQLGIMAAMYVGCSPIYLLGLDHDWLSHIGPDRHFYQGLAGLEQHSEVRPTLASWPYKELMESQLKLWYGYETLLDAATHRGIRIINATNGGFLDVFDRTDYEEILGLRAGGAQP
jgi:hypothetical protein